ncbi:hypothetical protein GCM10027447_22550 [Glycomyces halotolerans]
MTLLRIAPLAAAFVLVACGQGGTGGSEETSAGAGQGPDQDGDVVYQGALTVIETPDHGPQLTAAVAQSYPPQGGGMDVVGWDWDAVAHESAQGTSWGHYIVTGTYDGEAFVLTEDPVPTDEIDMSDYPHLQHTEPEVDEPAERLSHEELQGVVEDLAERFPDLVTGGRVDEAKSVARVDVYLVTPELDEHVSQRYPDGAVVFTRLLQPVS